MKVDANGLICPEPIMMLHKAINDSIDGAIIELEATDPTAVSYTDLRAHET